MVRISEKLKFQIEAQYCYLLWVKLHICNNMASIMYRGKLYSITKMLKKVKEHIEIYHCTSILPELILLAKIEERIECDCWHFDEEKISELTDWDRTEFEEVLYRLVVHCGQCHPVHPCLHTHST